MAISPAGTFVPPFSKQSGPLPRASAPPQPKDGEGFDRSQAEDVWLRQAEELRQRSWHRPATGGQDLVMWTGRSDADPEGARLYALDQARSSSRTGGRRARPVGENLMEKYIWDNLAESERGREMAFRLALDPGQFYGGSQVRVAERVRYAMQRPDLVRHYLSENPRDRSAQKLSVRGEEALAELHRNYYAQQVGPLVDRVGPTLTDLLQKNRQNEADRGRLASLTASSVAGMRSHIATLVNDGKLSELEREQMLKEVDGFYADLMKSDPELGKATRLADPLTAPQDKHLPDLDETFELARRYPGKMMMLDTKTSNDPTVARRMAEQLRDKLKLDANKDMRDRVVIMNPDPKCLEQFKEVFAAEPELRDFKNFSWDDELLNDAKISLPVGEAFLDAKNRNPLVHSAGNRFVSIGNPRSPIGGNFDDLVEEVAKSRRYIDKPDSPYRGKKLLVWTLNDQDQIEKIVNAGADGVLTDDPDAMARTLDRMQSAGHLKRRPLIIAHRGGPASEAYPENTMNAMRAGFEHADAIEIDLVSTTDGILLLHDNDPGDAVATLRNLGLESNNPWRPVFPDLGSPLRRRADQLSSAQVRQAYYFVRH